MAKPPAVIRRKEGVEWGERKSSIFIRAHSECGWEDHFCVGTLIAEILVSSTCRDWNNYDHDFFFSKFCRGQNKCTKEKTFGRSNEAFKLIWRADLPLPIASIEDRSWRMGEKYGGVWMLCGKFLSTWWRSRYFLPHSWPDLSKHSRSREWGSNITTKIPREKHSCADAERKEEGENGGGKMFWLLPFQFHGRPPHGTKERKND